MPGEPPHVGWSWGRARAHMGTAGTRHPQRAHGARSGAIAAVAGYGAMAAYGNMDEMDGKGVVENI